MSPAKRLLLLAAVVALAGGCACRKPPVTAPLPGAPVPDLKVRQEMGALAFIAYLGEHLTGSDDEVEIKLAPCLEQELAKQPLTKDRWTLAWGPAVYKFAGADLDDNMLYVVKNAHDPSHLVIATRGTNADAILDWLVEDFEVEGQVAWKYGTAPKGAKIARGTSDGLDILRTMVPAAGPVAGKTLSQFLAEYGKGQPALQIDVAGHSLGGALAPTLALWLADTRADWDPGQTARIAVHSLAGPTAGNAAFAAYSDSRIGTATDRMHNPLDIVPLAWNCFTMGTIAGLYKPFAEPDLVLRAALDGARDLVRKKGYTQIRRDAPPLRSALNKEESGFVDQVGWQHTCGYYCALGLVGSTFLPVTLDCKADPPPTCPVCP